MTPGSFRAALTSTEVIRACAYGLRRKAMCSIPGSVMLSVQLVWPVMRRSSSLRRRALPSSAPFASAASVCAVRLDGQDGTTLDRLPVKQHRACAAIRRIASDGSPGLAHHFSQVMDKQHPGLYVVRILHAIDGDGDFCHAISSPGRAGCISWCKPRTTSPRKTSTKQGPDLRHPGHILARRIPAAKPTANRRVTSKH